MSLPRRVWIDTDPAITAGNGEVDDAFAIILALRSAELHVVGISAVHGNASADHAYDMAKDIVRRAGHPEMPIYRGSHEAEAPCPPETAMALSEAIAEGPLTILALGPLSTIAHTLGRAGVALNNVSEIVFVGGRRLGLEFRATPTQKKPFRDMNFECDVAAAEALIALGLPITLASWEVSSAMWVTPADLDHLSSAGDDCAAWLASAARGWQGNWQKQFGAPGFTPFDTLAVGWLLWPELFAARSLPSRIWHDGKRSLFAVDESFSALPVNYLRSVEYQPFHDRMMHRLLSA